MSQESSRSHAIFTITIEVACRPVGFVEGDTAEASGGGTDGDGTMPQDCHIRVGKLNFVDLAGSERQVSHWRCTPADPLLCPSRAKLYPQSLCWNLILTAAEITHDAS